MARRSIGSASPFYDREFANREDLGKRQRGRPRKKVVAAAVVPTPTPALTRGQRRRIEQLKGHLRHHDTKVDDALVVLITAVAEHREASAALIEAMTEALAEDEESP